MFGKKKDTRGPFDPCNRGQHQFIAFGGPFQTAIDTTVKQRVLCQKCSTTVIVTVHEADDRIRSRG